MTAAGNNTIFSKISIFYPYANPDRSYEIWIVHDGLTGENIQELRKAVAAYPHVLLHFSTMPDKLAAVLDHRDVKRFSSLAYARLLAASLLPSHNRIVYLDADTVCGCSGTL